MLFVLKRTSLFVIVILGYFSLTSSVSAQSFFTSSPGTNFKTPSASVPKAEPSPVLTPSEYQSQVNSRYQQVMDSSTAKFQQQYKSSNTSSIYNNNSISSNTVAPSANPGGYSSGPASPSLPSTQPGSAPANPKQVPGNEVAPSPSSPQPVDNYTGFGSGNNANSPKSPAPASNNSGGWNIKY